MRAWPRRLMPAASGSIASMNSHMDWLSTLANTTANSWSTTARTAWCHPNLGRRNKERSEIAKQRRPGRNLRLSIFAALVCCGSRNAFTEQQQFQLVWIGSRREAGVAGADQGHRFVLGKMRQRFAQSYRQRCWCDAGQYA